MSKQILAATVAATGLLFIAGVTRSLSAAHEGPTPPDIVKCTYNGSTCEYEEGIYGYWSGCDTTYPQGKIFTRSAWAICETYHAP
jgi:hypothetical protein